MLPYTPADAVAERKQSMQALEVDSGHFTSSKPANVISIPKKTFRVLYGSVGILLILCIVLIATRPRRAVSAKGETCDNIVAVEQPCGLKLSSVLLGSLCAKDFMIGYQDAQQKVVSPWHHIPLKTSVDDEFNMVVEIPRYTKRKWEISTKVENNPIAQDVHDNGELREYAGPLYWNYGALPRTFESPGSTKTPSQLELVDVVDDRSEFEGDGDPLDVVEIGDKTFKVGEIVRVKVLGVLAMIDSSEVDWKLIAISIGDARAADLTLDNIDEKMPGVVSGILEWFRWYKTPDGKKLNIFGKAGKPFDRDKALEVISETHEDWKKLVNGEDKNAKSCKMWVPKDFDPEKADKDIGQAT